jgi:hypothetical protein
MRSSFLLLFYTHVHTHPHNKKRKKESPRRNIKEEKKTMSKSKADKEYKEAENSVVVCNTGRRGLYCRQLVWDNDRNVPDELTKTLAEVNKASYFATVGRKNTAKVERSVANRAQKVTVKYRVIVDAFAIRLNKKGGRENAIYINARYEPVSMDIVKSGGKKVPVRKFTAPKWNDNMAVKRGSHPPQTEAGPGFESVGLRHCVRLEPAFWDKNTVLPLREKDYYNPIQEMIKDAFLHVTELCDEA